MINFTFKKFFLFALCAMTSVAAWAQPDNDDCAEAFAVMIGADRDAAVPVFGDTRDATQSADPVSVCSGSWFADDVWFSLTIGDDVPADGIIVETLFDPIDDPDNVPAVGVAIYQGCGADAVPINCFSNGDGTVSSLIGANACLSPGDVITIRVWSGGSPTDNSGTFEVIAYNADPVPPFDRPVFFFEDFEDGLDGWTAETAPGTTTDSNYTWVWYDNGVVPSFFGGIFTVGNPTSACSGMAAYPGGFYQTENNPELGAPPYPIFEATLTSPTIDVSNTDCNALSVSFDMLWRQLNGGTRVGSGAFVEFSLDDGATWSDPVDLDPDGVANGPVVDENREFVLAGAGGTSQLRIRFAYDSDFYVLGIDNVRVFEPENNDLRVQTNFFAGAPNLFTPATQVQDMAFLADIRNRGCVNQPNTVLAIDIFDPENNLLYTGENNYGTVDGGALVENDPFDETYTPPAVIGQYTGQYRIFSDSTDINPADNSLAFPFVISENLFAKENGGNSNTEPAAGNWDQDEFLTWGYANYYYCPSSNGDDLAITTVLVDVKPDASYAGEIIDIIVYEWSDTNGDGVCQATERDDVAIESLELTGTEDGEVAVTLEDAVPITDDQAYLVAVEYFADDADAVVFPIRFNTTWEYGAMALAFDSLAILNNDPASRRFAGFSFLEDNDQADYTGFTGFTGSPAIASIRMVIDGNLVSTEDDLPTENLISVYPNPTVEEINLDISLLEMTDKATIAIYDITGQMILTRNYDNIQREKITLNVSDFSTGTYFVQYMSEEGSRSLKFVKE